jgi:hypothetical protein
MDSKNYRAGHLPIPNSLRRFTARYRALRQRGRVESWPPLREREIVILRIKRPLFPNGPERGNRPATIIKHESSHKGKSVD